MLLIENHKKIPFVFLGSESPIDKDNKDACVCSYCFGKNRLHYGLNIPKDKSWNSWFVIKIWKHFYIRFTLPFLKE